MVSDAESLLLFASCYGQVRVITPVLPAGLGRLRNHPFLSKILGSCPFLLSLLPDIKAMTANRPKDGETGGTQDTEVRWGEG